jgi:hypothetical protein
MIQHTKRATGIHNTTLINASLSTVTRRVVRFASKAKTWRTCGQRKMAAQETQQRAWANKRITKAKPLTQDIALHKDRHFPILMQGKQILFLQSISHFLPTVWFTNSLAH